MRLISLSSPLVSTFRGKWNASKCPTGKGNRKQLSSSDGRLLLSGAPHIDKKIGKNCQLPLGFTSWHQGSFFKVLE